MSATRLTVAFWACLILVFMQTEVTWLWLALGTIALAVDTAVAFIQNKERTK